MEGFATSRIVHFGDCCLQTGCFPALRATDNPKKLILQSPRMVIKSYNPLAPFQSIDIVESTAQKNRMKSIFELCFENSSIGWLGINAQAICSLCLTVSSSVLQTLQYNTKFRRSPV